MSKAILIMDEMPHSCFGCPLVGCFFDEDGCDVWKCCANTVNDIDYTEIPANKIGRKVTEEDNNEMGYHVRPDWCPLQNMPPEATPDNSDMPIMWNVGWNACLKELEGNSE